MNTEQLSRKGKLLYDYIAENGQTIDEWKLRDATGLSHGTFCAARKELVEAGLLTLGKDGRKTTYELTPPSDMSKTDQSNTDIPSEHAPADTPTPSPLPLPPPPAAKATMVKPARQEAQPAAQAAEMPRVAGSFNSFDDWLATLTMELGGCVNVSESLVTPNEYIVYADGYDQEDRYIVTENDFGGVDAY